jgi:hypothetical protein
VLLPVRFAAIGEPHEVICSCCSWAWRCRSRNARAGGDRPRTGLAGISVGVSDGRSRIRDVLVWLVLAAAVMAPAILGDFHA